MQKIGDAILLRLKRGHVPSTEIFHNNGTIFLQLTKPLFFNMRILDLDFYGFFTLKK
jgi:hypothetical protein